jgi:hypothetical protein
MSSPAMQNQARQSMESPAPKAHAGDLPPRPALAPGRSRAAGSGTGSCPCSPQLVGALCPMGHGTRTTNTRFASLALDSRRSHDHVTRSRNTPSCGPLCLRIRGEDPIPLHKLADSPTTEFCFRGAASLKQLSSGKQAWMGCSSHLGTDVQFVTHAPTPERAIRPSLCAKGFYLRQEHGLMISVLPSSCSRGRRAFGILANTTGFLVTRRPLKRLS